MGKVILEFDSIEEQEDIRTAIDGYKWKLSMWDLDQHLRGIVKYGDENYTSEQIEFADKLRDEIRSILNGYSLNLEN